MAKKKLTTGEWAARLNALGREMDDQAASLHPSAWPEQMEAANTRYRKLASVGTCDAVQLEMELSE